MTDTVSLRLAMVACLLMVAATEAVVGRTDIVHRIVPGADTSTMLLLEEKIIRPNPDPAVVIFGTSRARGAFLPTEIEDRLKLHRGQVLNLAMGGGVPLDALKLYERNRETLRRARVIVFQIDAFQFTLGIEPTLRYRYFAQLEDRLAYKGAMRRRLLGDVLFRMDTARPLLRFYFKEWIKTGHGFEPIGIDRYGRLALVYIGDDHLEHNFTDASYRQWLDAFYREFEYAPAFEGHLLRLLSLARADGARVYLVYMPTPQRYYAMLRAYPHDPHGFFRTRMQTAVSPWAAGVRFWESPAEVGLSVGDYRDWAHLNTTGAIKWTRFFTDWLVSVGAGVRPQRVEQTAGSF